MTTSEELFHLLSKLLTDEVKEEAPSRILYEKIYSMVQNEFSKVLGEIYYPRKKKLLEDLYEVLNELEMLSLYPELAGRTVVGILGTEGPVQRKIFEALSVSSKDRVFTGGNSVPMVLHPVLAKDIEGMNLLESSMNLTPKEFLAAHKKLYKEEIDLRNFIEAFSIPVETGLSHMVFLYFPNYAMRGKAVYKNLMKFCDCVLLPYDERGLWQHNFKGFQWEHEVEKVYVVAPDKKEVFTSFFSGLSDPKADLSEHLYVKEGRYGTMVLDFLREGDLRSVLESLNTPRNNISMVEEIMQPLTSLKTYLTGRILEKEDLVRKMNEDLLHLEDEEMGGAIRKIRLDTQDVLDQTKENYRRVEDLTKELLDMTKEYEGYVYASSGFEAKELLRPETLYHGFYEEQTAELIFSLIEAKAFPMARRYGEALERRGYPYAYLFELYMDDEMKRALNPDGVRKLRSASEAHERIIRAKIRFAKEISLTSYEVLRLAASLKEPETALEYYLLGEATVREDPEKGKYYYEAALELGEERAGEKLIALLSQEDTWGLRKLSDELVPKANYLYGMHQLETGRYASGITHLKIAAAFSYNPAIYHLADLQYQRYVDSSNEEERSEEAFETAKDLYLYLEKLFPSDVLVEERLGHLFYEEGNMRKASLHLLRAKTASAYYLLGRIYEEGEGAAQVLETAESYYKKAAQLGHEKAEASLAKVQGKMKSLKRKSDLTDERLQPKRKIIHTEVKRGCFITTATCLALGKPDNCEEIMLLKEYRDTWLVHQKQGKELIEIYYALAPAIVKRIEEEEDWNEVYKGIYEKHLLKILGLLKGGYYKEVQKDYEEMVYGLKKAYGL